MSKRPLSKKVAETLWVTHNEVREASRQLSNKASRVKGSVYAACNLEDPITAKRKDALALYLLEVDKALVLLKSVLATLTTEEEL